MKLRMFVVDFELSTGQRRVAAGAVAACIVLAAAVAYAGPLHVWAQGDTLDAADLNANFNALDMRVAALESGPLWSSYTPTITSDGTVAASRLVRGGTLRYAQFGKTVCLQGDVVIGEQAAGEGGTYIKVSAPPNLPGATGVTQTGIGMVVRNGDASTLFTDGAAALETDVANFILTKQSAAYFTDGDARAGAGILWVASGCYRTN